MTRVHTAAVVVAAALIAASGALPHLNVHRNIQDHRYTLFATLDQNNDVSLVEAGPRLPEDMDLYRVYSATVHAHLCAFAWYLAADVRRTELVAKWQKRAVCILCTTALVTGFLFVFLADQFSAQGLTHTKISLSLHNTGNTVGLRASGAHAFQYTPLAVGFALYMRPAPKKPVTP